MSSEGTLRDFSTSNANSSILSFFAEKRVSRKMGNTPSIISFDLSNQRESDQISEPVARPEIRRMTPSDDVEPEIDDLHRWYTAHAEIEGNGNMELAQSSASSTQGESGSYEATFQPEAESLSAQHLHDSITADKTKKWSSNWESIQF